jgi:hypothetical protein
MLRGEPQGSILGPILFVSFINDICAKIHFYKFLLFADDVKIFRVIKSAEGCKLIRPDIDSVKKWCIENYKKINIFQTDTISFTRKTNSMHFNSFLGDLLIVRTDCAKDLRVLLERKLLFHRHVNYSYLLSEALKLLGLIRFIT